MVQKVFSFVFSLFILIFFFTYVFPTSIYADPTPAPSIASIKVMASIVRPLKVDPTDKFKLSLYFPSDPTSQLNFDPNLINDGNTSVVDVYFLLDDKSAAPNLFFCFKDDPDTCVNDPKRNLWGIDKDSDFSGKINPTNSVPGGVNDDNILDRFKTIVGDPSLVDPNNIVHVRVCGSSNDWVDSWGQCDGKAAKTGYDNLWFHPSHTNRVTLYESILTSGQIKSNKTSDDTGQLNQLGDVQFYIHHFYPFVYLSENRSDTFALATPVITTDPASGSSIYAIPKDGIPDPGKTADNQGYITLPFSNNTDLQLAVRLAGRKLGKSRGDNDNNYSVMLKNNAETYKRQFCTTVKLPNDIEFKNAVNIEPIVFNKLHPGNYTLEVKEQVGETRSGIQKGIGIGLAGTLVGASIGAFIVQQANACDQGFAFWRIDVAVEKAGAATLNSPAYQLVVKYIEKDPDQIDTASALLGIANTGNHPSCTNYDAANKDCKEASIGIWKFSTDPAGFVTRIMSFLLSIAGMITTALMIAAGYQFIISRGDKQKLQAARDRIVSLITGLLFIIFSLVILQFITVTILHLPGFGQ